MASALQHPLLDAVKARLGVKTDGELARRLGRDKSKISYIRTGRYPLGGDLRIQIFEMTGITFSEMRAMLREKQPEYVK